MRLRSDDRGLTFSIAASALSRYLVHHHRGGYRDIQRWHLAQHRNRDQVIAFVAHVLMQTMAFRTEDQRTIHFVINLVIELAAALIKSYRPDIVRFDLFNGPANISDLCNGQIL